MHLAFMQIRNFKHLDFALVLTGSLNTNQIFTMKSKCRFRYMYLLTGARSGWPIRRRRQLLEVMRKSTRSPPGQFWWVNGVSVPNNKWQNIFTKLNFNAFGFFANKKFQTFGLCSCVDWVIKYQSNFYNEI